MKLPTQASPVRRFAVQDYSNVQETLEEAANKTNSLELKLKPKKENDSSSPFKDFKEILKEVSSEKIQKIKSSNVSIIFWVKPRIDNSSPALEKATVEHFIICEFPGESSTQEIPNANHQSPDKIQEHPIKDVKKVLNKVLSGGSSIYQTPNANHQPPDEIQEYPSQTGIWTKLGNILQHLKSHC